jgi:hypothetical protein
VSSIYVWGAQLEPNASASTYSPTPASYGIAPNLLLSSTNASVVDTTGSRAVYFNGNANATGTSRFGTGAMTFDGTNSWNQLIVQNSSDLVMGTQDFTVEFWMITNTGNSVTARIFSSSIGAWTSGTFCIRHESGVFRWNGNTGTTQTFAFTTGIWYHIAYTRKNTTGRCFINGQLQQPCCDNTNYTEAMQYLGGYYTTGPAEFFNGMLDDVRVTKGVARYQDNFVPPSRALPKLGGNSFVANYVNQGVIKTFSTVGTFSWTAPVDVTQIELLVVAGGAGGGSAFYSCACGGGGGAGGLIYNNTYSVTPGQTYTVVVGAGGAGGTSGAAGSAGYGGNGGNSQFGNLIATGGGGGGNYPDVAGQTGGSGGGGGGAGGVTTSTSIPIYGQGFLGGLETGTAASNGSTASGGGGGAGASGGNGVAAGAAGSGGAGLAFNITGTYQFYSGGGGGGGNHTAGSGGSGVGGAGASSATTGVNGSAATGYGSGGGGAAAGTTSGAVGAGGAGYQGIVVLRYSTATTATTDPTMDNVTDSPASYGIDRQNGGEVYGNYCTWNPILSATYSASDTAGVYSNGNLTVKITSTATSNINGTMGVNSGQYYLEYTIVNSTGVNTVIGVSSPGSYTSFPSWRQGLTGSIIGTASSAYGITAITSGALNVTYTTGDVIGMAFDFTNLVTTWYKNGTVVLTATFPAPSAVTGYYTPWMQLNDNGTIVTANFGQQPWKYTPPAGYNAWSTQNLPQPTVTQPNLHFDTVLYTGNGAATPNALTISSLNFQPDLVWIKSRSIVNDSVVMDSVRGTGYFLQTDTTSGDLLTGGGDVSSFNSNGFTISYSNTRDNQSSATYVAWCWKAGGTPVANTAGTISSMVSANPTAGFSIISYTGNGINGATVGHGLSSAPKFILFKQRPTIQNWSVYHGSLTSSAYLLLLNSTTGQTNAYNFFSGATTSSVIQLGTADPNAGVAQIAYCWAEVPGFSKFGSYGGNGLNDGPYVFCGFRPKLVLIKRIDTTGNWVMIDSLRNTANPALAALFPNLTNAEGSYTYGVDLVSNGFKVRETTNNDINTSGGTYIFAAWAETPFKEARGR